MTLPSFADSRCSTVQVKRNSLYIQRLKFSSPAVPQIQLDWWVSKPQKDPCLHLPNSLVYFFLMHGNIIWTCKTKLNLKKKATSKNQKLKKMNHIWHLLGKREEWFPLTMMCNNLYILHELHPKDKKS